MKKCSICKNFFDKEFFHKNRTKHDGLTTECKECVRNKVKDWAKRNPERASSNNKRWREENSDYIKNKFAEWYNNGGKHIVIKNTTESRMNNPEKHREYGRKSAANYRSKPDSKLKMKESRIVIKKRIIEHYTKGENKCACCGESHYEFLSVDHINGGGNKHRKEIRNFYSWIIRNNFPDGFRILCMNCNFSYGKYGMCPHNNPT